MTLISDDYLSYTAYSSPQSVQLADKSSIDMIGDGTVKIVTIVNGVKHKILLQHTLLVPALANSLLSVKPSTVEGTQHSSDLTVSTSSIQRK